MLRRTRNLARLLAVVSVADPKPLHKAAVRQSDEVEKPPRPVNIGVSSIGHASDAIVLRGSGLNPKPQVFRGSAGEVSV